MTGNSSVSRLAVITARTARISLNARESSGGSFRHSQNHRVGDKNVRRGVSGMGDATYNVGS